MNWKNKAFLQNFLGALPFSTSLNYFFQRWVVRNLPVSDDLLREKINDAAFHFQAWQEHGNKVSNPRCFEFGAGWDLVQPLSYRMWGAGEQVVSDVSSLVKLDLVRNAILRLGAIGQPIDPVNELVMINRLRELGENEILYHAPMRSDATGLESSSFDMISSTNTLEHVPVAEILPLLQECHRLLKPEGVMSCRIDYQDHYAYFDSGISLYNYLQFSEKEWSKYNVSLQFQNRLRHKDYLPIFEEAGLEVVRILAYEPSEEDLSAIASIDLDEAYQNDDPEELAIRWAYWVVRRK
jgi:SAM-dependent methyltransferase